MAGRRGSPLCGNLSKIENGRNSNLLLKMLNHCIVEAKFAESKKVLLNFWDSVYWMIKHIFSTWATSLRSRFFSDELQQIEYKKKEMNEHYKE